MQWAGLRAHTAACFNSSFPPSPTLDGLWCSADPAVSWFNTLKQCKSKRAKIIFSRFRVRRAPWPRGGRERVVWLGVMQRAGGVGVTQERVFLLVAASRYMVSSSQSLPPARAVWSAARSAGPSDWVQLVTKSER